MRLIVRIGCIAKVQKNQFFRHVKENFRTFRNFGLRQVDTVNEITNGMNLIGNSMRFQVIPRQIGGSSTNLWMSVD